MHKVARLCWNTNYWITPSGSLGKSGDSKSFENENGYGWEEWLFDLSKPIDGYIYGYVTALSRTNKYVGEQFDLSLYAIEKNKKNNQRYWIGAIKNLEVIDTNESSEIYAIYKKNGWIQERLDDLKTLGITNLFIDNSNTANSFFNVKYNPKDLDLMEDFIPFSHKSGIVNSNYYTNLLDYTKTPINSTLHQNNSKNNHQKEYIYKKPYSSEEKYFEKLHAKIQNKLIKLLELEQPDSKIEVEKAIRDGSRADIFITHKDGKITIYEVKIAHTIKKVVRDSIGQLLEYAYDTSFERIKNLVVISPHPISEEIIKYIDFLQKQMNVPISYQQITLE